MADALEALGLPHGLILTDSNAETIESDGKTINIRSLVEWLLEGE